MGASWSHYTISLGGIVIAGHAVWAVGSMGDCNQLRDVDWARGFGWGGRCGLVARKPEKVLTGKHQEGIHNTTYITLKAFSMLKNWQM